MSDQEEKPAERRSAVTASHTGSRASASVTCEIDTARRRILIAFTGPITPEQVISAHAGIRALPTFDPTFRTLMDCQKADLSELGAEPSGASQLTRRLHRQCVLLS